jgi:hypothetical protein
MVGRMGTLRNGTTVRVLAGRVDAVEALALLAALDACPAPDTAPPAGASAWRRAARMEALGGRPAAAPSDVDLGPPARSSGPRRRRSGPVGAGH